MISPVLDHFLGTLTEPSFGPLVFMAIFELKIVAPVRVLHEPFLHASVIFCAKYIATSQGAIYDELHCHLVLFCTVKWPPALSFYYGLLFAQTGLIWDYGTHQFFLVCAFLLSRLLSSNTVSIWQCMIFQFHSSFGPH